MEKVISMQKQLMSRVPHELRPGSYVRMIVGARVIESLLNYLNSTGHKPWRPNPLPMLEQEKRLNIFIDSVHDLKLIHYNNPDATSVPADKLNSTVFPRQLISAFGIIEESIEYINEVMPGPKDIDKAAALEELVDQLFFWAEQLIMSGFTIDEAFAEYERKWKVNIKRYESAEKGDYSWDKRSEGKL